MKHTGKISFNTLTEKTNKNVSPMQKRSQEMEIYAVFQISAAMNLMIQTNNLMPHKVRNHNQLSFLVGRNDLHHTKICMLTQKFTRGVNKVSTK